MIKLALEEWCISLERAKYPSGVFTDHCDEKYIQNARGPMPDKLAGVFTVFYVKASYLPGSKNVKR